ncbi:hypothetical protein [Ruminococcus sp.]|uniref:hypothetical protein n=1 Tax=Ruminococcus sp. TaxID=41978 RepID=UPI003AAA30A6
MQSNNEKDSRYTDIIDLPHHTSNKHPRMSAIARAAQFSPFAALTDYDAEIKETARLTDEKVELDEDSVNDINAKLHYIKDNIDENPEITVEYFVPDEKKAGGAYLTLNDRVRIIDEYEREVVFISGKRVIIDDIYKIFLR